MHHHPLRTHRVGGAGALQDVLDAAQPLLFLNAGERDVVGGVQRQSHLMLPRLFPKSAGRFPADAHAPSALIFIGVQAHADDVLRHLDGLAIAPLPENFQNFLPVQILLPFSTPPPDTESAA